MPGSADETDAAAYRPLLFSIAYGMTGSVGDAEDIVQDAFVGMTRARQAGTVIADPKAYLTTAVTRLGINYLRSARVRRETYVGDWLPEPVVVPAEAPGPAEHAELADSLSMAFLVLLEALSPVERAVFMLREVFGYGYPDVARITGKTEVNCRQIFARARQHIAAGRAVGEQARITARRAEGEELARRFFEATAGGDMDALLGMLAPDVVFHGDGGGKAQAIGQPLAGRQPVMRLLAGLFRRGRVLNTSLRLAWVNGQPGAVAYDAEGRVISVFALDIADGVVQAIHSVVNPDKLAHIGPVSDLARLPEKGKKLTGHAIVGSMAVAGVVRPLLDRFTADVSGVVPLVALWAHGSLALGDYQPGRSDLDLVALTQTTLTSEQEQALRRMHEALHNREPLADKLHCAYVVRSELGDAGRGHLTWAHGELFERTVSPVTRRELCQGGLSLLGPAPATVVPPVTDQELADYIRGDLRDFWYPSTARAHLWLRDIWVDLGLLTFARATVTLREGRLVTKREALEVLTGLDAPADVVRDIYQRRYQSAPPMSESGRVMRGYRARTYLREGIGQLLALA